MKNIFIIGLFTILTNQLFGQVCNANFTYTINNNVVSVTDSSTNSCPGWSGCCFSFNYGDTTSGRLNTWSPFGLNHFYKNPGTYTICEGHGYTNGPCTCSDTICKQINITSTGSNCQAKFCYTATVDTLGYLQATLYNTSTSDDSITNVYWDFNDGLQSTIDTIVNHFYWPTVPDQLTYLYIQTISGCQSVIVDTIKVGSNCNDSCLQPVASFSSYDSMLSVNFLDSSINATSWYWDFGDGNTDTVQNPMHLYNNGGTYDVCLYASSICDTDTICQWVNITGVGMKEDIIENNIVIYPNPNNGKFILKYSIPGNQSAEFIIFDVMSRKLKTYQLEGGMKKFNIANKELKNGLYFYQVIVNNRVILTDKLVIIKK